MSSAVLSYASYEESLDFLSKAGLEAMLSELAADNFADQSELEESGKVTQAVLNRPELLHFAALCCASSETFSALVRVVASSAVRSRFPLAGIWSAYADALVAFSTLQPSSAAVPERVSGAAMRYLPYIQFMQAQPARQIALTNEMAASFAKWNKDKRATDWLGLDGDGNNPVKWDFRLAALRLGANNSSKPTPLRGAA